MVFLRFGGEFGDAAAEEVGLGFGGHGAEGMVGRRLVFCWGGGEKGFGVGGEVLGAVGGVEAFGKDDEVSAGAGGFEDFGAGAGEIGGFVGAGGELDEGEFEGLLEEVRHCGVMDAPAVDT